MGRSARGLWSLYDLLQPVRSLANGWHLGLHGGLVEAHDGSVQMIDTSIVRVHQHGGECGIPLSKAFHVRVLDATSEMGSLAEMLGLCLEVRISLNSGHWLARPQGLR
jgi:hypothetical protein